MFHVKRRRRTCTGRAPVWRQRDQMPGGARQLRNARPGPPGGHGPAAFWRRYRRLHDSGRVSRETRRSPPDRRLRRLGRSASDATPVRTRRRLPQTIGSGRTDRWVRCPEVAVRGILRREVAAVRPTPEGPCGRARPWPSRRGSTRSMTLLLAAVGATLMALLELTVGPYLQVGSAQPHLVLVVGIVVTVAVGLEAGLVWAFVGGLVLDVLVDRPLGSTSFALLLCVGATAVLARLLVRFRPVVPILATLLLSLVYSMIAVRRVQRPPVADPRRRSDSPPSSRRRLRHDPGRADRAPGDLDP